MAMAGGNQQLLAVPPSSANASSSVSPPLPPVVPANTSSSAASNATNNGTDSLPPPPQGAVLVPVPAQAPVAPPPEPTAAPSSTPLPPPPVPSAAATPLPQPDPSPVVPPSVSPPPPPTPVSPSPPPPPNRTPPPPNRTPPPPSPPPSSPPPPPSQVLPPPTSQVSPSPPPPPPPQPVILSPPPQPNAAVSPPPPPTAITPPSPSPPPPPLHPANSSASTPNSSTPALPLPASPPHSFTPPRRNHSTSTAHSPRQSGDSSSSSSSTSTSTSNSSHSPSSGDHFPVAAVVGGTVAAVVALALVGLVLVIINKRKKSSTNSPNSHYNPPPHTMAIKQVSPSPVGSPYGVLPYKPGLPESGGSKSWFSYEELRDITGGFSQEHLLGQGGFGFVYKGRLPDGRTVAIKQLKVGGGQGEREFRAEVEIISRVHHRHLVSLVGYCISESNRLLVYEYVPNRTLEYHLHAKELPVMEWSKRMKIAIGSARGLAYLHEDCHPRIIHRDIKSANILLDDCFEAQVADFGLAKLTNDVNTHVSTRVMGTFGYMAPEYAASGKLTDRSDVFSFGVVLLELITGRKPVDESQPLGEESLVEWARPVLVHTLETGDCEELVDPRLENNFAKSEMMMMIEAAAACVRHNASKRPRMVQVVRALDSMRDLSDLSNGVKYGESTLFNSRQYSEEIGRFQRAAFESGEFSSDFGTSREHERRISIFSDENPNIP